MLDVETVQVGPRDEDIPPLPLRVERKTLEVAGAGTPAWWLRRLMTSLDERQATYQLWDDYYSGRQVLSLASDKYREAFGRRFRAFTSNFCSLVVDATRERIEVEGFRFSNARSTRRVWRIWQDNSMDSKSQTAHTEALVKSVVYTIVEPRLEGPRITVEDPMDTIVETDPRDATVRLAGLKRWQDERGHLIVFLYLPDFIWKFASTSKWGPTSGYTLSPLISDTEPWPLPNRLGVVPIVPLVNRPRLDGTGVSEIEVIRSNQDVVNKLRADVLVAAEFAAFRQRWAIGLDIPEDPTTGQPIEPFKAAVDRLWVIGPRDPDDPDTSPRAFGEFSQTDLTPYQRMIEHEVGAISSISRIPYHYLLGQPQAVPPSGESLKSSEAGLIRKVGTTMLHFGEGWEETMRLALLASGDSGAEDRLAETDWKDPETRNEAVRTDSIIKQYSAGLITKPVALEELGYGPERIRLMMESEQPPEPQPEPEPQPVAE